MRPLPSSAGFPNRFSTTTLRRDCEALMVLPPAPFDACGRQGTRVSSLSLARYRTNDYSVPVAYGHREVWIRGYVHEVVIGCGGGIIARHPRSYERDDMVFDPVHYLPLLEQKIAALDQAAPLAGRELPGAFPALRRLLEARIGKSGKREYVQVLRLLETFDLEALHGAVKDALRLGAIGYDAVKHAVLGQAGRRFVVLGAIGLEEEVEGLLGHRAGLGHPDVLQVLLGAWAGRTSGAVEHVGGLVRPCPPLKRR